ncbi:hypothetical protein CIM45_02415 [Salmonella enterica subsp. enterica serovar Newport]|uniref:Uncharacterized protein n=1 Tax=Salmonella newport TaxID=108619 RepID=A0A5Z7XQG2_SALNE|nr:hypothetical protein [Salmonella enterica]ECS7533541.1 hypothetical protein [Salmonella enterica subsp. enterica serovar Newport]ECU9528250.1 hypothetical protein [Salmonella enterica subsp. enterica serovar Sandiego]EAP8455813.1 hypothetical protein [Salmonella enterica]EAQ8107049.1 hypothetical protein [Salmonella enterica]
MNITTTQYRQGVKGCFLSAHRPQPGESLTLVMPTCRGRRFIPVGKVQWIEAIGSGRCLVWVSKLAFVEGMNY